MAQNEGDERERRLERRWRHRVVDVNVNIIGRGVVWRATPPCRGHHTAAQSKVRCRPSTVTSSVWAARWKRPTIWWRERHGESRAWCLHLSLSPPPLCCQAIRRGLHHPTEGIHRVHSQECGGIIRHLAMRPRVLGWPTTGIVLENKVESTVTGAGLRPGTPLLRTDQAGQTHAPHVGTLSARLARRDRPIDLP